MSRIHPPLSTHSRLAIALLLLGALLCFGLGQVLGHPLIAVPAAASAPHQTRTTARQVTLASGTLAATLSQPQPLAAPPAHSASSIRPPMHHSDRSDHTDHSDHAKGGHHGDSGGAGQSGGISQHGNGHHRGNGGGNGGGN